MPRPLTAASLAAMMAQSAAEAPVALMTIDHEDITGGTIRVTNNKNPLVHNGKTYLHFPFDLQLAQQDGQSPPQAKLALSNVDRKLVETIRSIQSPPAMTIGVVLASAPDDWVLRPEPFILQNVDVALTQITGTIGYENVLNEAYPSALMSPGNTPGLFNRT